MRITDKKPTLAIIGSKGIPFVYSGYETFVRELSLRLREKYEIHVYCHRALFSRRPSNWNGVYLHYLPAIETKYLTHFTAGLFSTLHALTRNYDLYFYVNSCNGPFGWLLNLFGKRTLLNTDGIEWERPQVRGFASLYYYWASKQAAKYFQILVADCQAMAVRYEREFGRSSEVIAYGANILQKRYDPFIGRLGLSKDSYYLIVGRLIPDNNACMIIEEFLRSRSEKKLVIVGNLLFNDPYLQKVKRYASEKVIFVGFVKEHPALRTLFINAFGYIHGHEFGGTNPALLEALAASCCVLALDTPFNREVLSNEEYGLLFLKKQDSLALLIRLLENRPDLLKNYRDKSANRIRSAYTWENICSQYDELFQRLLDGDIKKAHHIRKNIDR